MSLEHAPQRQKRGAYSVAEFAEAHGISVGMLYKMWARGEGPDFFKAGTRTLIGEEAGARWRKARERAARRQLQKPEK